MIKIELVGNKIHLQMPYSAEGVRLCRTVRGGKWQPSAKRWTYPLDYNTCVELRTKVATPLKQELDIGPLLWEWAANEAKRIKDIPDPNSMERAALPIMEKANPFLYQALNSRPFQTVGVKFAAANRQVILADEPGLGKTAQTIGTIIEANVKGPILVVAPKAAAELTWPQQINQWSPGEHYTSLAGLKPADRTKALDNFFDSLRPEVGQKRFDRQWLIINPYWLMAKAELNDKGNYKATAAERSEGIGMDEKLPDLFAVEWAAVIVDESHDILVSNTMNRKKWIQARIGAENLWLKDNAIKMALSGTPMRGKKENFFGTLQWLKPEHYTSYWAWAERHFHIEQDGYSFSIGEIKNPETFRSELKEVMIRRTKSEVAKDLPAKIYGGTRLDPDDPDSPVGVWLPMAGKQLDQYNQMRSDGVVQVDGGELIAMGVLSEWTRLKQLASSAGKIEGGKFIPANPSNKMDWIMEFLAERGIAKKSEGDGKVIIVSQFAEICNFVERTLAAEGIPSFILTGNTPLKKRQEAMELFQSPSLDTRVFILSTKAGGVSLTLDAADDVIIIDETYIPDNQLQVEDRAHRVSRPDHQVSIWYLRTLDSIEEAIAAVTGGRQMTMDLILDKSRGIEIRKRIKEYIPLSQRKEQQDG